MENVVGKYFTCVFLYFMDFIFFYWILYLLFMIANLLRLVHSALIIYIFVVVFRQQTCPLTLVLTELAITLMRSVLQKQTNSGRVKIQIILSFMLGYATFPNKFKQFSWLYFAKIIQVHRNLKQFRKSCFLFGTAEPQRYITFLFDIFRYSLNQFTFFWIICIIYRFLCDEVNQPIPETHKLIYQLVVTASTIGYGDLTPKSDMQIIFFIFAIPVLCASFIIYINGLVDAFSETFLKQEQKERSIIKSE